MNYDYEKLDVFSSPLRIFENKELAPKIRDYILSKEAKGIESNVAVALKKNLIESRFDVFETENEAISDLKKFIATCIKLTLNEISNEDNDYVVAFQESWYHIGLKNSYHAPHSHGNCSWCGVYYVQSGDKESGGNTVFNNPVQSTWLDAGTLHLSTDVSIIPRDGKLILFPSYLSHYQSLYTGEQDRIVTAFNSAVKIYKN